MPVRTVGIFSFWCIAAHRFSRILQWFIDFTLEPVTPCLRVFEIVDFRDDEQYNGIWTSISKNNDEMEQFGLPGVRVFISRIFSLHNNQI